MIDFKDTGSVITLLLVLLFVVLIVYVVVCVLNKREPMSEVQPPSTIISMQTEINTIADVSPKGILKRPGQKSQPKNVRFEEFVDANVINLPSDPWYQADTVNKYDPKFVDVFKTAF